MNLNFFDYRAARRLHREDAPFYALIAAAMWKADTFNAAILRTAYPDVWDDLQARYAAPGGVLPSDSEELRRKVEAGEVVA